MDKMKCPCDDCLVCYVGEYSQVKFDATGKVIECSSYVAPTKENIEGYKKSIDRYK